MGLHTDLRIHTAAAKLLEAVTESTLHMRRDGKKPIGERMIGECLDIQTLIQRANIAHDKAPHLEVLLEKKCRVESLLNLSLNKRLISPGLYGLASREAKNLGQQAVGWRKNSKQRQLHDRQGGHASA